MKTSYYQSLTPEQRKEYNHRLNHAPASVLRRRKQNLNEHGLTLEKLEEMFVSQNGKCAICQGQFQNRRKMHVDHNHTTGKIRKLLCYRCNVGLGMFREDETILLRAINYLRVPCTDQ